MPRTKTRPLDDPKLWRRLIARTHPDAGGDHELFIWCGFVRDAACSGELQAPPPTTSTSPPPPDDRPRIPYPVETDFEEATRRALRVEGLYSPVLARLTSCHPLPHLAHEEARGASYKRLAAIAHTWGMSPKERSGWYRCAESIPLSDRHAAHILSKLKRQAA